MTAFLVRAASAGAAAAAATALVVVVVAMAAWRWRRWREVSRLGTRPRDRFDEGWNPTS